jgi:hypothetical protein
VSLKKSTTVRVRDDGTYSAKAFFTVQGQDVAIRCISTVRAVVVAFLEYINFLFSGGGSTADWSLDQIARGAQRDLRNRGFSDNDITLNYINQFNETHVVQISRLRFELTLASK